MNHRPVHLIGLGYLGAAWLLAASVLYAQQITPPFVFAPKMQVVDPWNHDNHLVVQRITHLICLQPAAIRGQSPDPILVMAYQTIDQQIGLSLVNAATLHVEQALRFTPTSTTGTSASIGQQEKPKNAQLPEAEPETLPGVWDAACVSSDHQAILIAHQPMSSQDAKSVTTWVWTVDIDAAPHIQGRTMQLPEPLSAAALFDEGHAILALTTPGNAFVRWTHDASDITENIFDFVPYAYPPGQVLHRGPDGAIYGSYKGRLFAWHPKDNFFEYLGMLPCEFGHLSEVALTAMSDDGQKMLVGGTSGDGYLFTVDLASRQIRSLGRPTDAATLRCLVRDSRGRFWGISDMSNQCSRLFCYDPASGDLRDLGIPSGILQQGSRTWNWRAYRIADMTALPDGRIVLSEIGRQPKLLVFDPATWPPPQ